MSQPNSVTQDNDHPPQLPVAEHVTQINRPPSTDVHPPPLVAFAEAAAALHQLNHAPPSVLYPTQPVYQPPPVYPPPPVYQPPSVYSPPPALPTDLVTGTTISQPSSGQPVNTPPAVMGTEQDDSEGMVDVLSLKSVLELAGNDKGKALMAMAIGTTTSDSDATPIFDPETEPFASSKTKSQWRPSQAVLRKEINRRAAYLKHPGERTPKCNGWNMTEQYKWLTEHPHTDKEHINWIRQKVTHYKDLMIKSAQEKLASMVSVDGPPQPKFNKNEAWMRLTMALMHHRQAFLERDCCLSRDEIEANRGTDPPKTVYQLAAETFNDPSYTPTTPNYSQYSSELSSRKLVYDPYVGTVLTADKAKQLFRQITSQLKVIYTNYQKSGNGDGQHAGEDDEGNNYVDGSDKISFCQDKRGKPMNYVLFFWLYLEESGDADHNIIQDALAILPTDQSANSSTCPKMNDRRKRAKKDDEYSKVVALSIKSISEQGETQLILSELKDLRNAYNEQNNIYYRAQIHLSDMMISRSNNPSQYHNDAIEDARKYLLELKKKLDKLEAKIEEMENIKKERINRDSSSHILCGSSSHSIPTTVGTGNTIEINDDEEDEEGYDDNELNSLVD
jgi:hypothetical protein